MSDQQRATISELAAEFERAIGSLAEKPIVNEHPEALTLRLRDEISKASRTDVMVDRAWLCRCLTRIAAIALEGAARLRRGT